MLEILLIIALARKIGALAREKGRAAAGYVVLFLFLWLGGEFAGAIFGVIATEGRGGLLVYVCALFGAALGAGMSFLIVSSLPEVEKARRPRWDDQWDAYAESRFEPQTEVLRPRPELDLGYYQEKPRLR